MHQFNEQCSDVTAGLLYYKCIGTIGTRSSCPEASIDVQNMAIGVLVAVLVVLVKIVLSEIARTPIELILGDTATHSTTDTDGTSNDGTDDIGDTAEVPIGDDARRRPRRTCSAPAPRRHTLLADLHPPTSGVYRYVREQTRLRRATRR